MHIYEDKKQFHLQIQALTPWEPCDMSKDWRISGREPTRDVMLNRVSGNHGKVSRDNTR